ncbi:hypothetical protein CVT26_015308 [Gymnopilus dilepis]|uniref:C2H2-type domain-containing protein n=1 Tax=Gymnopilus dilepis TaxID=231916 RepID=A0A409W4B4_9AGAR|nr:hypothetical protein CVT26_015308 [Gymnopilus dilepis]
MNQLRTQRFDPVRDAIATFTPPAKILAPPQPNTTIDVRHVSLINPFMHNPCISPLCEELIDTGNPIAFTLHMHLKHYHELADRCHHPRGVSRGDADDSETEDDDDREGTMPCLDPKCESVVADEQRLYDHIKDVHWKLDMHACPACEQVVGGHETGLMKHIWTDHAGVQVLSGGCPISKVEDEE